jgi:hypothetical protein
VRRRCGASARSEGRSRSRFRRSLTHALRAFLDTHPRQDGVGRLKALLDRRTFVFTESRLEERFLPLVEAAGLPVPLTRQRVNGFKVDFYWPHLGLVVETNGLRRIADRKDRRTRELSQGRF